LDDCGWSASAPDREYSPFDFQDRVQAAAKAGFKGVGIWHADLDHILVSRSLTEMKQIFDDNGITHVELEFLATGFWKARERCSPIFKSENS